MLDDFYWKLKNNMTNINFENFGHFEYFAEVMKFHSQDLYRDFRGWILQDSKEHGMEYNQALQFLYEHGYIYAIPKDTFNEIFMGNSFDEDTGKYILSKESYDWLGILL